jgi:WD40 repeat protein
MERGVDFSPSVATPEMVALVASALRGYSSESSASSNVSMRHVPPERLWNVLNTINLKSLLYSPLVEDTRRHMNYQATDITSLPRIEIIGRMGRIEQDMHGNDAIVKSIQHRFSVYGHKIWLGDIEESVPAAVFCSAMDKWNRFVATGGDDGLVKIWSVETGHLVATLKGHAAEICDLRFSPCMTYLVSSCQDDRSVVVWKRDLELEGHYSLHIRLVDDSMKPMSVNFTADEASKLVIAYAEGVIVAYDCNESSLEEFSRFTFQQPRTEFVCFGILPGGPDIVSLAVSVKRRGSGASVLLVRMKRGSPTKTVEYSYPVSGAGTITQIQSANKCSSFVASDDEPTGSLVYYKEGTFEYQKAILLSSEGLLVDLGSLIHHLKSDNRKSLEFSVNDTLFTANDEFIIASVSGHPHNPIDIGEDDAGSIYCILVFRAESGSLVGILGETTCRGQIFALGCLPIDSPWSYLYYGSYDGSLTFTKIRSWGQDGNELVLQNLSQFNINTDHGSNIPRSILDCQAGLEKTTGELVVVVSDGSGSVSVFSNDAKKIKNQFPAEQFFTTDYDPGFRVTSERSGGILCDSRMIPLSELRTPRPPIVGTIYSLVTRDQPVVEKLSIRPSWMTKNQVARPVTDEDKQRKKEREDRLQRLAAMAAAARSRSPEQQQTSVETETNFERASRRTNRSGQRPGLRQRVVRERVLPSSDESSDESISSASSDESVAPQPVRVVPTQLRRDMFIRRTWEDKSCCLCLKLSGTVMGPFPISDLDDSYFHPSCLFSLNGLEMGSYAPMGGLAFSNLDILVRQAISQGKCAKVGGGCRNKGAGIKCFNCRKLYHYDCAIETALRSGYYLDPVRDPLFVCPRCDPPEGLDQFSRRMRWRREESVRSWLYSGAFYVPQMDDTVVYFPPDCEKKLVSDLLGSGGRLRCMSDLAVLTWNTNRGGIAARVESIDYVFPSFFDDEQRSVIMRVGLVGLQDGISFSVHYRPRINASDVLILKSRVDSALATRFHETARPGMRVRIPIDGGIMTEEGIVENIVPDSMGWECLDIRSVDDDQVSRYSLWELDLSQEPAGIGSGPTAARCDFLTEWIRRIVQGPVKNARNRIDLGPGMNVFQTPPWTQPGAESYLELIEYPVWLDLIVKKLDNRVYRSIAELKREVTCILYNCSRYNDPQSLLVSEAQRLVETLTLLTDLDETEFGLYPVPAFMTTRRETSPSRRAESRQESPPPPRSIRVSKRKFLKCDHCGAEREVSLEVFNEYSDAGKRVRCRWIGFNCVDNSQNGRASSRRNNN